MGHSNTNNGSGTHNADNNDCHIYMMSSIGLIYAFNALQLLTSPNLCCTYLLCIHPSMPTSYIIVYVLFLHILFTNPINENDNCRKEKVGRLDSHSRRNERLDNVISILCYDV